LLGIPARGKPGAREHLGDAFAGLLRLRLLARRAFVVIALVEIAFALAISTAAAKGWTLGKDPAVVLIVAARPIGEAIPAVALAIPAVALAIPAVALAIPAVAEAIPAVALAIRAALAARMLLPIGAAFRALAPAVLAAAPAIVSTVIAIPGVALAIPGVALAIPGVAFAIPSRPAELRPFVIVTPVSVAETRAVAATLAAALITPVVTILALLPRLLVA